MASSQSRKVILITLILTIAIPIATCHRRWRRRSGGGRHDELIHDKDQYLRDICSETQRSDVCVDIIKKESRRFENTDEAGIAEAMVELAVRRSLEIGEQLNQWYEDSNDKRMKERYRLCADNYFEANRILEEGLRNLGFGGYGRISDQIDGGEEELEECRREFEGSPDPGHVGDRNSEFGVYLDMIRAASARLEYHFHQNR